MAVLVIKNEFDYILWHVHFINMEVIIAMTAAIAVIFTYVVWHKRVHTPRPKIIELPPLDPMDIVDGYNVDPMEIDTSEYEMVLPKVFKHIDYFNPKNT